jgi:peptide-methionine (S)-S-oxide reductase
MFFLNDAPRDKLRLPTPDEALPGRAEPIPTAARHFVFGRPLHGPYPEGSEIAYFGMGCFWGVERLFWQMPGVWVTAAGYQGGITANPTYRETCTGLTGHAETVMVVFDPATVSYGDLLRLFWESHDPTQGLRQGNDVGTTYRSAGRGRSLARGLSGGAGGRRARAGDNRNRAGAGLLFRRGRAPAISGEEPGRLLRPQGHRRRLRDRLGQSGLRRSRLRRHPGQGRGASAEPGPIGQKIVRHGPVLALARFSARIASLGPGRAAQ